MRRKLPVALSLVFLAALLFVLPASALKEYDAGRFDVQIDLQEDGSAVVTETVEFNFRGDPFTYAFREISAAQTDGLTFLDASMDGVPMAEGTAAGQVEVERGDPLKVTWHFPPAADTSHVFTVRYLAEGVIRKGDADSLVWRAVPEDHDYAIGRSAVTLTYPEKATLLEPPSLSRAFESFATDSSVQLAGGGLAPDEDLILTARFAPNSITEATPGWQVRSVESAAALRRGLPIGLLAGLVTLVLGGLALFSYARANRRELNVGPVVSTPDPPANTSPAIVGKLTSQPHTVMGAIFDLAQRGFLEIREEAGFLGSRKHWLVRRNGSGSLQTFEWGLLDALFEAGETEVNLSQVPTRLGRNKPLFEEPLEQELVQRGWLDPERKRRRTALLVAVVLGLILSLAVLGFGLAVGRASLSASPDWLPVVAALAGISVGLFVLSIPSLIYASTYSPLTPDGEEQVARWNGFARYLKLVSKGKEVLSRPEYFERYLAYAAVFGLGKDWARYFQQLGGVPLPVWFHATAGQDGDFAAIVAVMSASDSAGASGGGDGGAGAGASGGGASGAG